MMAAEVSNEDTGSVKTGTGGGGPETAPFPFYPNSRVRVSDLGQGPTPFRQNSNTSPDSLPDMSLAFSMPAGDMRGPALSASGCGGAGGHLQGTGGSSCYSPSSDGPDSRVSPTSSCPDGPSGFPPLPPPPPSVGCGGPGGALDESDMPDGPEWVDDDEVVFPLSAPPTNQRGTNVHRTPASLSCTRVMYRHDEAFLQRQMQNSLHT